MFNRSTFVLITAAIIVVIGGLWLLEVNNNDNSMTEQPEPNQQKIIELPDPSSEDPISLEEAIAERRSIRNYREGEISRSELSRLLWAAQGITGEGDKRAAPSAGATYPLELYIAAEGVEGLEPGLYRYRPEGHLLEMVLSGSLSNELQDAALGQTFVGQGSLNLIIAADYQRTTGRYDERGERYVHMEVGHAGQNIYLQAENLGLGTVAVGAFDDSRVKELLDLPDDQDPLYIMPVGRR